MGWNFEKEQRMRQAILKFLVSVGIGLGAVLAGAALILFSPLVTLWWLFSKPSTPEERRAWGNKIKDLLDPDGQEPWKRDHRDLYGENE